MYCLSLHLLGPQADPGVLKGPILAELTAEPEGIPSSPEVNGFSLFFRKLLGIITKKDVLKHIAQMANQDPDSILFN